MFEWIRDISILCFMIGTLWWFIKLSYKVFELEKRDDGKA